MDDAAPGGMRDGVGAASGIELVQDRADVEHGDMDGNAELSCDHLVGGAFRHQREYIEWLTEAKQEATREKRLATALEWLAEGKPRNWKYMKR